MQAKGIQDKKGEMFLSRWIGISKNTHFTS